MIKLEDEYWERKYFLNVESESVEKARNVKTGLRPDYHRLGQNLLQADNRDILNLPEDITMAYNETQIEPERNLKYNLRKKQVKQYTS